MPDETSQGIPVPVFLLKTQSTPGDSYLDKFTSTRLPNGRRLAPEFVPVMRHKFDERGLALVRSLLREGKISCRADASFGGLIFTSQRSVEAFAHVVNSEKADTGKAESAWPNLIGIPVYSVGPATTRALSAVSQVPALQVFGEHTGNGEALAHYMLEHYGDWYRDRPIKPPMLFLVGEQRRDIISKTLMDPSLAAPRRIEVTEEVIYGTGVMESFPADFDASLKRAAQRATKSSSSSLLPSRWVVVFSPMGCDSMLRGLGLLDDSGKVIPSKRDGKTYIATIGPTTRDYLIDTFGFQPDVCAEMPSPEGVLQGIADFEDGMVPV